MAATSIFRALAISSGKDQRQTIAIPGPLRSFSRMAALAPEIAPDDVLPALARNVVTNGYQAAGSNDVLEQTEYLKLVVRYLSQARELEKLADSSGIIKIETCDSTQTGELLRVLGYRMRGGCGSEVVLETLNATRAFLTIDSGFPLAELEQDLRTNRPFAYDFKPTQVPILYTQDYWLSSKDRAGRRIHRFISRRSFACAACIWRCRSWTPPLPKSCAKGPRFKEYAPTRTFWISTAACSRFEMAEPWCRAAPARKEPGPSWWEPRPTSRGRSSNA